MLGGESQLGSASAQIKIGVAPAMQFAGTAQGLTRPGRVGVLAGVMNQQDGQLKVTLELTQEGKQGGDLRGVIFIEAVQTDQRVQDE